MEIYIYSLSDAYAHKYIALDEKNNFLGIVILKYDYKAGYFKLDHMRVEKFARKQGVATALLDAVFNDYNVWFKKYGVYATSCPDPFDSPTRLEWGNYLTSLGVRVSGSDFSDEAADKALHKRYGSLTLNDRFALYIKRTRCLFQTLFS